MIGPLYYLYFNSQYRMCFFVQCIHYMSLIRHFYPKRLTLQCSPDLKISALPTVPHSIWIMHLKVIDIISFTMVNYFYPYALQSTIWRDAMHYGLLSQMIANLVHRLTFHAYIYPLTVQLGCMRLNLTSHWVSAAGYCTLVCGFGSVVQESTAGKC